MRARHHLTAHELYFKLVGQQALPVSDRRHFFAYAARVMRYSVPTLRAEALYGHRIVQVS